jgi:hypothetical protein
MNRSNFSLFRALKRLPRGMVFGGILLAALLAFEIFNYSTTDFALTDLLGPNLKFAGVRWTTILSFAFCGIDFAVMNAMLTWWGISVAVTDHTAMGSSLVSQNMLTRAVPVFVAIIVWLIRVLIIGTFSRAGENLFSVGERSHAGTQSRSRTVTPATIKAAARAPALKPQSNSVMPTPRRVEPTYHPIGISARPNDSQGSVRR